MVNFAEKCMRRVIIICLACVVILFSFYEYYQYRWQNLWVFENERTPYPVICHEDDTIRVAMIGDSWAEMHASNKMDSILQLKISSQTGQPVIMTSKGKGGEKSRGIYQLLFDDNDKYGTKEIIASGLDYCVISAGINDASANLGPRLYCYFMRHIIKFLLSNKIRPVLIEIPDVNLWKVHGRKPLKDLASDYLRSIMTHCKMYQMGEYRDSLRAMLINENLMDSVIYIHAYEWNGNDTAINQQLFLNDQIHLNKKGYELLDSCIAKKITSNIVSKRFQ